MSKGIDWASAPEGYPIWVESKMSTDPSDWHRLESNGYLRDRQGGRWESWQVRDGECVPHYKPEWDGEGLPPVGTVCEVSRPGFDPAWIGVTVLCIGRQRIFMSYNVDGSELSRPCSELIFRPVRTAEQIAVRDRDEEIQGMVRLIDCIDDQVLALCVCATLHDAGYRKQVAP